MYQDYFHQSLQKYLDAFTDWKSLSLVNLYLRKKKLNFRSANYRECIQKIERVNKRKNSCGKVVVLVILSAVTVQRRTFSVLLTFFLNSPARAQQ